MMTCRFLFLFPFLACAADKGEVLFRTHCAPCHGPKGDGGRGSNLAVPRLLRAPDDAALSSIIVLGIPGTQMPATRMTEEENRQLVAYVRTLGRNKAVAPAGDPARGEQIFWTKGNCGKCHAIGPRGGRIGPDLTEIGLRRSAAHLRASILDPESEIPDNFTVYRRIIPIPDNFLQVRAVTKDGRTITGARVNEDTFTIQIRDYSDRIRSFLKSDLKELDKQWGKSPMPSYRDVLSEQEIQNLIAYLSTGRAGPRPAQLEPREKTHPGDWLTYSGTYNGHRHSPLTQITTANVANLRPIWQYQTNDLNPFEVSPIVTGGVMYISEPPSNAAALDAKTGRPMWTYRRPIPTDVRVCCGQVNRGLGIRSSTLFLGTVDAHLVALDAKTGRVLWDVTVADYKTGHSITLAPLVVKNMVVIGISGGEYGIRGFLDAYDAATGARRWRFWTIPGPGEPGHETWEGESWKIGSAATWITGSYDPELNLIYWGTGNPGPDYNGAVRKGDNLYANSLIALNADSGKLKWHFQFTPHDTHDWDANHVPLLIDAPFEGAVRKLVAIANRNAFYYMLDRVTGKFLLGKPYGKQTWAKELDDRGRPVVLPGTSPTPEGKVVYPGLHGATNWNSPAYSPETQLVYVAAREEGTMYYHATAEYKPGAYFSAGGIRGIPGVEPKGSIKALEVTTGKQRWEFPLQSPPWGGVLATAGALVFGGSNEGDFFALDAATGKPLWRYQTGGPVLANPISYLNEGKQHIAIAAGHSLFTFALDDRR